MSTYTSANQPLSILLVDDNEDDMVLAQEAFAAAGMTTAVQAVAGGIEALELLRRESPHAAAPLPTLVLLDLNMPRMNGFETLWALKADSRLRAIPVVILTVSDREEDVARAYSAGASSYVRKPSNFADFIAILRTFEKYWTQVARLPHPG